MAGGRRRQVSKPAMPRVAFTDDYFTLPHPLWMVMIPSGLVMLFMATFSPSTALQYLPWLLGDFVHYMGRSHHTVCVALSVFAVVAHCVEAAYAGKVCQDKRLTPGATVKWSFSTFVFGFSSLIRLIPYKSAKASDKQH